MRTRVLAPAVVRTMKSWSRSHLADHEVVRTFIATVVHDCITTADLLASLAELDARKLYVPVGYTSMHAYCTGAHHMSEDAAFKRIRAARTARQFPAIFDAVAEGRLNLSGALLLAPHLTAASAAKTRDEIELLLAERFPKPDVATSVVALTTATDLLADAAGASGACQLAPGPVGMTTAQQTADALAARAKVTPLAPQRFEVKFTIGQEAHELLGRAQDLLGHAVPAGDVAEEFLQAMRLLVRDLEKRRFAATGRPRPCPQRHFASKRHVPVWKRDGGQCL